MNKYRVFGIISAVISFVFFMLMLGFICGALGAFTSAALWVAWLVLADFFFSGGL